MGCRFLLQRIFLTWGLNSHLLSALQEDSLPPEPPGKPTIEEYTTLPSGMGLSAPRILGGSIRLEKNDWTLGGPDEGKRLLSTSGDQPTCGFWCPHYPLNRGFPGGSGVKNPPANAGEMGLTQGCVDPLENEMATHSSILAWEIPWTKELGRL